MKKNNLITLFSICMISAIGFQSCNKGKDEKGEITQGQNKTITIDCSSYTQWQYFSFSTGLMTSALADSATDDAWSKRMDWDIAFHRQDVRTNSSLLGQGNGGVLESSEKDISLVNIAPETGYIQDGIIQIYLMGMGGPGTKTPSTGTTVTNGWVMLNMNDNPPQWVITKKVFIVKTADGKYAKIYLKNFLNDQNKSGFVTLQYFYQTDGSTNLNSVTP